MKNILAAAMSDLFEVHFIWGTTLGNILDHGHERVDFLLLTVMNGEKTGLEARISADRC